VLVTQSINKVMLHGKRSIAEKIVYDAMETIAKKTGDEPLDTVKRAVDNVKPPLEVAAAASVAPPTRCPSRSPPPATTLAHPLDRRLQPGPSAEKTMADCLANELMDAANGLAPR
jgi:small subunit ribosomal protein S7